MNNILKQLAEEADKFADDYLQTPGEFHPDYGAVRDQMFAELIIKECIICAEREWIRNGDTEHNRAVSKVIESIKEHFGIDDERTNTRIG